MCLESEIRCVCVCFQGREGAGGLTSRGHMVVQMCASHVCLRMCVCFFRLHTSTSGFTLNGWNQVPPTPRAPPPPRRAESGALACEAPLFAPSYKNLNMETVIGNCLDNLKWFIPGLRCSSQIKAEET